MMSRIPVPVEVFIRYTTRILLVTIATATIVLTAILVAPKAVGGQSFSVLSGSMSPAVNTGDMVVVIPQKADDIKTGQIVAFNDPNGSDRLYQHRVQSVREDNGQILVVTKGDANTSGEKWQTPVGSEVGRVMVVVPAIGTVIGHITDGQPVNFLGRTVPIGTLIVAAFLLLLAGFVITGILRSGNSHNNLTASPDAPQPFTHPEEDPTHA